MLVGSARIGDFGVTRSTFDRRNEYGQAPFVTDRPSACYGLRDRGSRPRVRLRLDNSEADAVLVILDKQAAGQPASDADWQRLFTSEPYVRLKKREAQLHRDFTDEQFKQCVLSADTVKRAPELRRTLGEWKKADLNAAARRVLLYLPATSTIQAKVFPVIKWQTNSFVYENTTDPTIFLYLDPTEGGERFEIIVAHELHHIGLSSNDKLYEQAIASLPPGPRQAAEWMGAFGEGLAMLAASGSPNADPVATYPPNLQAEWQRDMEDFNSGYRSRYGATFRVFSSIQIARFFFVSASVNPPVSSSIFPP
jgi:hypothetical protein